MITNKNLKIFITFTIFCLILLSYLNGVFYKSHLITSSQISPYLFEAISIVLTEHKYGFDGYQGKTAILEYLKGFSANINQLDTAINYILENDFKNHNKIHLLYVSEVGYVDFIRNSFYVFGYKFSSIYNFF